MNHTPIFLFPVWQGAGDKAVYHGALAAQKLAAQPAMIKADVSLADDLDIKNGIIGYDAIIRQLSAARRVLENECCPKLLTIGGGCDAEMLPISYLNRQYNGDLAVIWFDAHGDLNTPASSPSGLFHGMPLRCLLNEGDEQIKSQCFSYLQPRQIIFAGCRDFDEPEQVYICDNGISCLPPKALNSKRSLCDTLAGKAYRRVYAHIDLDVLCPESFSSVMCPTPGGISAEQLIDTLYQLHAEFEVVGIGIVEYVLGRSECEKALQKILACCEDILAHE